MCIRDSTWIPYLNPTPIVVGLLVMTFIAVGNGLFQPTQSTLLTLEARESRMDLGLIMGSQEGVGALSRVIGPLLAAFVWEATVDGTGIWTYHTVFHICGILMLIGALMQLKLKLIKPEKTISEN